MTSRCSSNADRGVRWRVGLVVGVHAVLLIASHAALATLRSPGPDGRAWLLAGTLIASIGTSLAAVMWCVGPLLRRLRASDARFREARQAEARHAQARTMFLAQASHEVRTPLSAVIGYAQMLGEPTLTAAEANAARTGLVRAGNHLAELVNDLLEATRASTSCPMISMAEIRPGEIAQEVATLLGPMAERKGLALSVEWRTALPRTMLSDATRLRQVLINLVGNAIKFTERGGVTIAVSFQDDEVLPLVHFDVIDTGPGMSEQDLGRLFTPFFQTKAGAALGRGGSGLGLSISRDLARRLGGDVTVRSTPGAGSTFRASVGAFAVDVTDLVSAAATPAAEHGPLATSLIGVHVLLAEDGDDNRRLLCHHLRRAGAEVDHVWNGREAVDAMATLANGGRSPHVVLLDVNMPELDGPAAATAIRAAGYRGVIIALTAHDSDAERARCDRAGMDGYECKPIHRERLVHAVRTAADAVRRRAA